MASGFRLQALSSGGQGRRRARGRGGGQGRRAGRRVGEEGRGGMDQDRKPR